MIKLVLGNEKRYETSETVINNLIRKGFTVVEIPEEPVYNPNTHKAIYDEELNSYNVIPLTSEEITEINKVNVKLFVDQKIEEGFLVQPENFRLKLQESDRAIFSQMLALVKEALDLGLIEPDSIQTIADKDGIKREVTALRFRQIMVAYGFYYKGLWDMLVS